MSTTSEAKLLVDRVKHFTNLLIVDSGPVSKNETSLNEICDYTVGAGLNVMVYFGKFDQSWQIPWLDTAKQRWGNKFLGIYFYDEPAGSLLDTANESLNANPPKTYDEMAELFVSSWQTMPGLHTMKTRPMPLPAFTSDYALYWFDYLAGYDVVFTQFGWNHTRAQDIALIRGAAKVQNKTWGAIITWTYDGSPYLDSGERLYYDMVLAYENGAKYISVFNYPQINDFGILQEEHFMALERFWRKITTETDYSPKEAQTALILPRNYGWGMRSPNDSIWGLWGPDEKSGHVWNATRGLLASNALNFDIIYEDTRFSVEDKYSTLYYWNSTVQ
ncbi:MAG TPA: hypothetical protein VJ507_00540 [Candidatus Bathyarchaeia archaeon]|nr:hypothetical protein [Candidatus Bathyarchaeia archaeon]